MFTHNSLTFLLFLQFACLKTSQCCYLYVSYKVFFDLRNKNKTIFEGPLFYKEEYLNVAVSLSRLQAYQLGISPCSLPPASLTHAQLPLVLRNGKTVSYSITGDFSMLLLLFCFILFVHIIHLFSHKYFIEKMPFYRFSSSYTKLFIPNDIYMKIFL